MTWFYSQCLIESCVEIGMVMTLRIRGNPEGMQTNVAGLVRDVKEMRKWRLILPMNLGCSLLAEKSLLFTAIFPGELGLAGFIEAKDDGGGGEYWSYKSCKAPVKSSPPTNQHPTFYRLDALPVAQPVKGVYCSLLLDWCRW